ncbi:hypothetical protein Cgig2_004890 [Carnegiea gigantea]|uniref:Uncharacterized protein n=1 Tax=Carnegiea gigantea TaxID=171969 RepID=A0A9Q1GIY1_9CARY|nr:hypothetical protein Cgig2_004890 [Carnegiea gigantea]
MTSFTNQLHQQQRWGAAGQRVLSFRELENDEDDETSVQRSSLWRELSPTKPAAALARRKLALGKIRADQVFSSAQAEAKRSKGQVRPTEKQEQKNGEGNKGSPSPRVNKSQDQACVGNKRKEIGPAQRKEEEATRARLTQGRGGKKAEAEAEARPRH